VGLLRRVWVNGAAVSVILAGAWGAINTPVFHASDVHVGGEARLSPARIVELSGVRPTTNVVRLSTEAVARRLEADPWIADASVTRVLPATVRIEVVERRPLATVRAGSRWALVAGDGTVLRLGPKRPPFPVLEGVVVRAARPGTKVLRSAAVLRVLSRLSIRLGPASARLVRGGVQIRLPSGARILYGDDSGWRWKNAAVTALMRWAHGQGRVPAILDVRVPNAPALALEPAGTPA
jgi:cell division protein FtsQ